MFPLVGSPMGRARGGRPPKDAGSQGTAQVRMFTDIAEKVNDLADLWGQSTAQVLDPITRAEIETLWNRNKADIEKMKELNRQQDEIRRQALQRVKKK